jgi:hypothetical protein
MNGLGHNDDDDVYLSVSDIRTQCNGIIFILTPSACGLDI